LTCDPGNEIRIENGCGTKIQCNVCPTREGRLVDECTWIVVPEGYGSQPTAACGVVDAIRWVCADARDLVTCAQVPRAVLGGR
jgi:hypothetical protein